MSWHLDDAQIRSYAAGNAVGARAASVEAHLLSCRDCRTALTPAVPEQRLAAAWAEIEERVDQPHRSWVERLLARFHVPAEEGRLLAAAPSLQLSWLVALAAVLAFAAAATHGGPQGVLLFLLLAPLAPVAAVAGAYGNGIDPTYEITRSTPYPQHRLLLLRVAAVVATSLVLTSAVALTVSDAWVTAAWLLPSLALVGLVLALSRWLTTLVAAVSVAAAYTFMLGAVWLSEGSVREVFQAPGQIAALAILVGCLLVVFVPESSRNALRRMS